MKRSTITSKGQITIPSSLRHALGLHQGDIVSFEHADNHIIITKQKNHIEQSFGILKASKGASLEDMQQAIEQGANDDHA